MPATRKISKKKFNKLDKISPFELKNRLIKLAGPKILNAGRGNPNFFNSYIRTIFTKLQQGCILASQKYKSSSDLKLYPSTSDHNYKSKLLAIPWNKQEKHFMKQYLSFLEKSNKSSKNTNELYYDIFLSSLGSFYPSPPQIQPHVQIITQHFMHHLIYKQSSKSNPSPQDFDIFATEGAANGILYVFNTLKYNHLLNPGDTIAIITPIFSPYLEIPILKTYGLKIITLKSLPSLDYSLPQSEIEKLRDKKIKGLFMVNPSNPGGYSLSKQNIQAIGEIVNTERQDLIILSDNVYAPFAQEYNSLLISCPKNTIEVFSLSKYFGTTGWRLGIVMVAKNNRFNHLIKQLPHTKQELMNKRYSSATIHPSDLTFINRIVFDSRQVAEAHVGGLSTPQQVILALMLYYDMYDKQHHNGEYKKQLIQLLIKRQTALCKHLHITVPTTPTATHYYQLLHIPTITENIYGKPQREYLTKNYEYMEFLMHLATKYHTVLLNGSGFGADPWMIRISIANLSLPDYETIGKNISLCIKDFILTKTKTKTKTKKKYK
jgi:aspartate 4-decarboxylase